MMALSFSETVEASHMGHADFRVGGKIFATLGYPDDRHGMLVLPPVRQKDAIAQHPEVFSPAKGAWGLRGSTVVLLSKIRGDSLRQWMELAWRKVAPT